MSSPDLTEVAGALLSQDLLDILDRLFPNRCPDPKDSTPELWMKAGERRAIEKMRAWHTKAKPNVSLPQGS